MILSALVTRLSITPILSATFAPPNTTTNGFSGLSNALSAVNSFSIKNPNAEGILEAIPTFDACALWIVPKASLIKKSASEAQYLPSSSSFLLSFLPSKSS